MYSAVSDNGLVDRVCMDLLKGFAINYTARVIRPIKSYLLRLVTYASHFDPLIKKKKNLLS